jgi:hypothetical protein
MRPIFMQVIRREKASYTYSWEFRVAKASPVRSSWNVLPGMSSPGLLTTGSGWPGGGRRE